MEPTNKTVVVTGSTGRQGGAVARRLLSDGWQVRGITRKPESVKARALAAAGVDMVRADMGDAAAMRDACSGAYGVFCVQNPMISGHEAERRQGINVVDAAAENGVSHLVYGAAGPGVPGTGVEQWDVKLEVADHARSRGVPLTVLRPMAFMELMTDKDLYPAVAVWHLMPRLTGEGVPIPWLSAEDLGAIAVEAFKDPGAYIGADLALASDVRTIAECRSTWSEVTGRNPRGFPMPVWLFRRFVGSDLLRMWSWLATNEVHADVEGTRRLLPEAETVEQFVRRRAGR